MVRTRIGVVGAGVIARRHVRTLAAFHDVAVVAVADPDHGRAAQLAATVDAEVFDGVTAMLDGTAMDAVYVCVPPFAHGEVELQVLARELPMFVEKPLAADAETALLVAERVAEVGTPTGVGYHWRWLDTVERATELLSDRSVRLVNGAWLDATPPLAWWQRQDLSGGQFVEQATHLVDLARLLAGDAQEVFGYVAHEDRPDFPGCDAYDVTAAAVRFRRGALGTFSATCVLGWPHQVDLRVYADNLALELTEKELTVTTSEGRMSWTPQVEPFVAEDRAFVDAVQGKPDRTRTTYLQALETHLLTTTVLQSALEGRPLSVAPSPLTPTGASVRG